LDTVSPKPQSNETEFSGRMAPLLHPPLAHFTMLTSPQQARFTPEKKAKFLTSAEAWLARFHGVRHPPKRYRRNHGGLLVGRFGSPPVFSLTHRRLEKRFWIVWPMCCLRLA